MKEQTDRPEPSGKVADATADNWVDRYMPEGFRPYLRLSRADRPIGTWLLLIPCIWGALLAGLSGQTTGNLFWVIFACVCGAFLMRGAGCTWNDFTDRHIDASVARTKSRPLPSGQVTPTAAIFWMCLQALVACAFLLTFNPLAIALGVGSLALVLIYPFAKRFTWWPQVFLGLAFNWGAILAYVAVAGELRSPAIALYVAGIAWTLFYDTIYAHQDRDDDALIGVKSTARLFGNQTHRWLRWFMVITVLFMAGAVIMTISSSDEVLKLVIALGAPWAMGWHLAWQNRKLDIDEPMICLTIFRSNRDAGLLAVLFLAAAMFA